MVMTRLSTFASVLLLSLLLGHALDAVTRAEWRLCPACHCCCSERSSGRCSVEPGLALFMMVHVGLHATLEVPGISSFPELLSRTFILGAGLVGADLLALEWWRERRAWADQR